MLFFPSPSFTLDGRSLQYHKCPKFSLVVGNPFFPAIAIGSPSGIGSCGYFLGVQKERMMEEDMYVLSPSGSVLSEPLAKPWPHKPPKCSDCGPLFLKAYEMRNAGAVIHSHRMESCLVTMISPSSKEFRITHMEMIKGIQGHGYYDELVVPIIENTAHERELTDSLAEAVRFLPSL